MNDTPSSKEPPLEQAELVKSAVAAINRELKRAQKRFTNYQQILQECLDWEKVHHDGLLLQANLFRITSKMKEIVVADWSLNGQERVLTLNPLLRPHDQVAALFRRSKKLRKGIVHAQRMLKSAEQSLTQRLEQKHILDAITDPAALFDFLQQEGLIGTSKRKAPVPRREEPPKPYKRYLSEKGVEIWVGKSAKNNDLLTFHYANGRDLWLHARNYPGSHVVVRCQKGQEVDAESLLDAAELAIRFSKANNPGEQEVCLAQVNALTRVKGSPGKVMLSKHKTLRVNLDNARWQRLQPSCSRDFRG